MKFWKGVITKKEDEDGSEMYYFYPTPIFIPKSLAPFILEYTYHTDDVEKVVREKDAYLNYTVKEYDIKYILNKIKNIKIFKEKVMKDDELALEMI